MNRMEQLGRNHAKSVEKLWEKVMKEDKWTSPTQTLEKWARRCEKQEFLIAELLEVCKEFVRKVDCGEAEAYEAISK